MMAPRLLAVAALTAAASPAFAQSGFSVAADAGVGYSSNPFLTSGSETGSGYANFALRPRYDHETARGVTSLFGTYSRSEYFRRYSHADGYSIDLTHNQQLTEKLSVNAGVGYNSSLTSLTDPIDITTGAFRQRRKTFHANGGFAYRPDSRSTWSAGAGYQQARYPRNATPPFSFSYDQYDGNIGYRRAVSETLEVGVRLSALRYESDVGIDSDMFTPALTFTKRFSDRLTLDGSAGVMFRKSRGGNLADDKSTGLAASLSLCDTTSRGNLCLHGRRDSSATGLGELRTINDVGVDYSYRVTERGTVTLNGLYSRSTGRGVLVSDRIEYATVGGRYAYELNERMTVSAGAGYRWRDLRNVVSADDISGDVALTIRLGGRR